VVGVGGDREGLTEYGQSLVRTCIPNTQAAHLHCFGLVVAGVDGVVIVARR